MNVKTTTAILVLCLIELSPAHAQLIKQRNPFASGPEQAQTSEKKGDWEYRLIRTNKGTRSEGRKGELFYKGKPYQGTNPGQTVTTDLGEMVFKGDQGANLWDSVGWFHKNEGHSTGSTVMRLEDRQKQ